MNRSDRVSLAPAYVLHQRDWRETSRMVELFSRDYGRMGAVARGARRAQSPWRAILQPFQPLLLSWMGSGDLVTLTGAEAAGETELRFGPALMSAYYMNELLLRLLPRQDAQPELFSQYAAALGRLGGAPAAVLRVFEKRLLAALGYGLILEQQSGGGPVQADAVYCYELERGPVPAAAAGEGIHISGAALAALAREDFSQPDQLQQTRELLHAALDRLLGARPLRTRTVMRALAPGAR